MDSGYTVVMKTEMVLVFLIRRHTTTEQIQRMVSV